MVALGLLASSSFLSIFFVIPFFLAKLTCQLDPITGSTESRKGICYLSCTLLSFLENSADFPQTPTIQTTSKLLIRQRRMSLSWLILFSVNFFSPNNRLGVDGHRVTENASLLHSSKWFVISREKHDTSFLISNLVISRCVYENWTAKNLYKIKLF